MEDTNKSNKTILYVVGGLVVIVLLAVAFAWYNNQDSSVGTDTDGAGEEIDNGVAPGDFDFGVEDLDGDGVLSAEEIESQADSRMQNIQSERERLIAEQADLETQARSTSSEPGTVQASAERQQEIEIELLELQNAEEYPPLPDPGT